MKEVHHSRPNIKLSRTVLLNVPAVENFLRFRQQRVGGCQTNREIGRINQMAQSRILGWKFFSCSHVKEFCQLAVLASDRLLTLV